MKSDLPGMINTPWHWPTALVMVLILVPIGIGAWIGKSMIDDARRPYMLLDTKQEGKVTVEYDSSGNIKKATFDPPPKVEKGKNGVIK